MINEHITNELKGNFPEMQIDVAPNTNITGAVSQETAVIVSSYPYGSLRCVMRYWLEYKAGKGTRLCSQTTNPKRSGIYWNAPKKSTYSTGIVVLGTDEIGHVKRFDLSDMAFYGNDGLTPIERIEKFKAQFGTAFTETDEKYYTALLNYANRRADLAKAKSATAATQAPVSVSI